MKILLLLGGIGILRRVAIRRRAEWLMNLVVRSVLGMIAIYFINVALKFFGISLNVGIDLVAVLTTGILGIPGLIALYGVQIYQLL